MARPRQRVAGALGSGGDFLYDAGTGIRDPTVADLPLAGNPGFLSTTVDR